MSIANTLSALKTRLEAVDPNPQPVPAAVFADPKEATSLAEFPCIILAVAPQKENSVWFEAPQNGSDRYTVAMYVLLGSRETDLPELHQRCLPWSRAIAKVLFADMTLGGQVQFIGDGEGKMFDWQSGPIAWGDEVYFGLKVFLPVMEWFQTPTA
jgi:hypothetical protein